MNARRLIWVYLLIFLGLIGSVGWRWHMAHLHRAAGTASSAQSERLARSIEALSLKLRAAQAKPASWQRSAAEEKAHSPAPADPKMTDNLRITKDPALRALHAEILRNALGPRWGPFFARLHLSADEIERFKTLETNRQLAGFDLLTSFQAAGSGRESPAYQAEKAEQTQSFNAAMQQLLGDQFPAYLTYGDELGEREIATKLAVQVNGFAPMSGAQIDQLTTILASARPAGVQNQTPTDPAQWNVALEQAKPLLQPEQFSALARLAQELQAGQRLQDSFKTAGIDPAQIEAINRALH